MDYTNPNSVTFSPHLTQVSGVTHANYLSLKYTQKSEETSSHIESGKVGINLRKKQSQHLTWEPSKGGSRDCSPKA